jgi:hypothetical protein
MGYVICTCGERISDVAQPNENEGGWASTWTIDHVDDLSVHTKQMFECPECGTLILEVGDGKVRHYKSPDGHFGLFKYSDDWRRSQEDA